MAKKAATRRPSKKEINDIIGGAQAPAPRKRAATKAAKRKPTTRVEYVPVETGEDDLPEGYRLVHGVAIPPYPSHLASIEAGEKTPAVKEWYLENHPDAHAALFGSKGN